MTQTESSETLVLFEVSCQEERERERERKARISSIRMSGEKSSFEAKTQRLETEAEPTTAKGGSIILSSSFFSCQEND
jgi:hypothetical protein